MEPLNAKTAKADKQIFIWRAQGGARIGLDNMDTDHMFNTVCMIWNNTFPDTPTKDDFKRYNFSKAYTPQYLAQALREMLFELFDRQDQLTEYQRGRLEFMLETIRNR